MITGLPPIFSAKTPTGTALRIMWYGYGWLLPASGDVFDEGMSDEGSTIITAIVAFLFVSIMISAILAHRDIIAVWQCVGFSLAIIPAFGGIYHLYTRD